MKNGFIKVAAATPTVCIANPATNTERMIASAKKAERQGVRVLLFPELSLTGCTCADLFFSRTLLDGAREALRSYVAETAALDLLSIVGLPVERMGKLYDCAALCLRGELLGFVPKTNLCIRDARYFASADQLPDDATISFDGKEVPFGARVTFSCREMQDLRIGVEIGDTLLTPLSADATVICNLAASSETVGADVNRRQMLKAQSATLAAGILYATAGNGESTTDHVFGGHKLICENGVLLAEELPFSDVDLLCSEIDVEAIAQERRRANRFSTEPTGYRTVFFSLPITQTTLTRKLDRFPFLPTEQSEYEQHFKTILSIQSRGLRQRIECAHASKLVLGISGGLDSTLALLVAARALDLLGRPHSDILAVTMPCFGTTGRTKNNATQLCEELETSFRCVDIFDAVKQHFEDIGHDANDHDVTYENSQARERTQILMDIANDCGGMVVGTGDLSELALGWATYNGDHMSMYGVNAGIPKTLVRHLVSYCADCFEKDGKQTVAAVLRDILDTPVSPELLPADEQGEIAQKTEDLVGPYELHDFYLYHLLRGGCSPEKLYRLAQYAWGDKYSNETLKKWLKILLRRFFTQQFKRSCLPDGPKVFAVGLSPRGDWMMPSDASYAAWLSEAETLN